MSEWFQKYLLPGLVLQSIIIGGGYGTGRELVEFFIQFGPLGALLGLFLSLIVVILTCMISFELARKFRVYDYRSFFINLIGRGWILYETSYFIMALIALAVIGSAAGNFLMETFAVPYAIGSISLLLAIAFFVFKGTKTIEKFLTIWSFVLYAVFLIFFLWSITKFGEQIKIIMGTGEIKDGWFSSGFRYGIFTIGFIPLMLFATKHIKHRSEAIWAGFFAGPLCMIPAILFYFAMIAHYPSILDRPVPANYILELLGSRKFQIFFQIMLFGTLIETGSGIIHAFNERLAESLVSKNQKLPDWVRPVIAIGMLLFAAGMARIGIIDLIAKGYGAISWAWIIIVFIPLVTIGVAKIRKLSI